MSELYDNELADDRWFENDVLMALDEELDPLPQDWELDFHEGWAALERGGPDVLRLEEHDIHTWKRLVETRDERLRNLVRLDAPKIVIAHAMALTAKARAGYYWQWHRRLNREWE